MGEQGSTSSLFLRCRWLQSAFLPIFLARSRSRPSLSLFVSLSLFCSDGGRVLPGGCCGHLCHHLLVAHTACPSTALLGRDCVGQLDGGRKRHHPSSCGAAVVDRRFRPGSAHFV